MGKAKHLLPVSKFVYFLGIIVKKHFIMVLEYAWKKKTQDLMHTFHQHHNLKFLI